MQYDLITILGPTASGKTHIAAQLAHDFNGEIISADSRQVYKGMDIGTGKDLNEFLKYHIKYHLIDIAEPTEEYNLFRFTRDFKLSFLEIKKREKLPILVGGTGLYLSSVLQSYYLPEIENTDQSNELAGLTFEQLKKKLLDLKPKLHNLTDLSSKNRLIKAILIEKSRSAANPNEIKLNSLNIGIKLTREESRKNITERLKQRLASGMIDEVKSLIQKGVSSHKLNYFGLEYKFVSLFVEGKLNYNDMFQKLNSAIHNFAKRQMTWFRKMEREGIIINWFHPNQYNEIKYFVINKLGNV